MSIVVGYIPTPEGTAALARAIAEAQLRNLQLVVVESAAHGASARDRHRHRPETEVSLAESLSESDLRHTVLQPLRDSDPAEEVLDAAEEYRAELIVIGLRRRTPVGKLVLGSTAQRILLEARCPVLAVKPAGN